MEASVEPKENLLQSIQKKPLNYESEIWDSKFKVAVTGYRKNQRSIEYWQIRWNGNGEPVLLRRYNTSAMEKPIASYDDVQVVNQTIAPLIHFKRALEKEGKKERISISPLRHSAFIASGDIRVNTEKWYYDDWKLQSQVKLDDEQGKMLVEV